MITNFFKRRSARAPVGSIPAGQRVYAIGDIHGCDSLLGQLIEIVDADHAARGPADMSVIFLGDLVDRGPDSAKVVERIRIMKQERPGVRILMGNHEEVFLDALSGDPKALKMFTRIGGRETIMSYGIESHDYETFDYDELAAALRTYVPDTHRDFMATFEDMVTIGDYSFVHAGVRPSVALDQQETRDLRWIREPFLGHGRKLDQIIVHGHTISETIEERPHRIGIDTGAYATGRLSAIGMEAESRWSLSTH